MQPLEAQVLEATIAAVSRFGMRKTSVNDIAEKAKVSRQTIYNLFGNKEDVYRAAILHMGTLWCAKAREKLEPATDLSEQLDAVFDVFCVDGFTFSRANDDTMDMLTEVRLVAPDALAAFNALFKELFVEVFTPHETAIVQSGLSVDQLADRVEIACRGMKREATSLDHLRTLIATEKTLVLNLVGL